MFTTSVSSDLSYDKFTKFFKILSGRIQIKSVAGKQSGVNDVNKQMFRRCSSDVKCQTNFMAPRLNPQNKFPGKGAHLLTHSSWQQCEITLTRL